jgi:hypothetical protein
MIFAEAANFMLGRSYLEFTSNRVLLHLTKARISFVKFAYVSGGHA